MKKEVRKFLDKEIGVGAGVNDRDEDGRTALMLVSMGGNAESVKALIKAGADIDIKNKSGLNALMYAFYTGRIEVLNALTNTKAHKC